MWYMSYLLFAAREPGSDGTYICETCNVLLAAQDAEEAYQAAQKWARDYENSSMKFFGIEELNYSATDIR